MAVTRPIIAGIYHSIGQDVLSAIGKREDIKLKLLGKIRSQGDGDTGIAFEYAVHDAVVNGVPIVVERVADALGHCRINRGDPSSILFAIEKSGSQQLISTEIDLITTESRVLSGERGQPVKLKGHLNRLAAAFRRPSTRASCLRASGACGRRTSSSVPPSPTTGWAPRSRSTDRISKRPGDCEWPSFPASREPLTQSRRTSRRT